MLPTAQQENLLALLCFDERSAAVIHQASKDVDSLFDSGIHTEIASAVYRYVESFQTAPGDAHLADILHNVLQGEDKQRARAFEQTLKDLYRLYKSEHINREYILGSLYTLVRRQKLRDTVMNAAGLLQSETEESLEEAERMLMNFARSSGVRSADRLGFSLSQVLSNIDSFLRSGKDDEAIPIGINELKTINFGPMRKSMLLFVAPTSRGKSWFLTHVGRHAIMQDQRVWHLTLEMSGIRTIRRYIQMMGAFTRRRTEVVSVPRIISKDGRFSSLRYKEFRDRPSIEDDKRVKEWTDRFRRAAGRFGPNLWITERPESTLSVSGFVSLLDELEQRNRYVPDVVIIDYPDKMKLSSNSRDRRIELQAIYGELRGLAVERNMCVVVVSQTNRSGEDTRIITHKHLAEDYAGKATIPDMILTFNQTEKEKARGIARLYVAKNRDEEGNWQICIAQAYKMGQFCTSSALMSSSYYDRLDDISEEKEG